MALLREFIARALVALAVVAGAVALGTWWASLLVVKAAGTLSAVTQANVGHEISNQLHLHAPAGFNFSQVQVAIDQVLKNPVVTQALATSVPKGSQTLSTELTHADPNIGSLLGGTKLIVDVGQHALARLAIHLRTIARIAWIAAAALAGAALILSPMRHLVLRHLAMSVAFIGGMAVLVTWGLPSLLGHFTHGGIRSFFTTILNAGHPVRSVLLECFVIGVAIYIATHLFELIGGRKISDPVPMVLPQGKVL